MIDQFPKILGILSSISRLEAKGDAAGWPGLLYIYPTYTQLAKKLPRRRPGVSSRLKSDESGFILPSLDFQGRAHLCQLTGRINLFDIMTRCYWLAFGRYGGPFILLPSF